MQKNEEVENSLQSPSMSDERTPIHKTKIPYWLLRNKPELESNQSAAETRKANNLLRRQRPKVPYWTLLQPNLQEIKEAVGDIYKSDITKQFYFIYAQIHLHSNFTGSADVQLKHSAVTDTSKICLIVLHLPNNITKEFYKKLLKENGIETQIEIVPSSKIQEITYEQLANSYDYFLVDSKLEDIWRELSKFIYKANRIGTNINMEADNLFEEVKSALTRIKFTFCHIFEPNPYKCRIGHIGMQQFKIEENILEIYNGFAKQLDTSLHEYINSIRLTSDCKHFGFIYKRLKRKQWIKEYSNQGGIMVRKKKTDTPLRGRKRKYRRNIRRELSNANKHKQVELFVNGDSYRKCKQEADIGVPGKLEC